MTTAVDLMISRGMGCNGTSSPAAVAYSPGEAADAESVSNKFSLNDCKSEILTVSKDIIPVSDKGQTMSLDVKKEVETGDSTSGNVTASEVEADDDAIQKSGGRGDRRSQYHSIQQLCSPAVDKHNNRSGPAFPTSLYDFANGRYYGQKGGESIYTKTGDCAMKAIQKMMVANGLSDTTGSRKRTNGDRNENWKQWINVNDEWMDLRKNNYSMQREIDEMETDGSVEENYRNSTSSSPKVQSRNGLVLNLEHQNFEDESETPRGDDDDLPSDDGDSMPSDGETTPGDDSRSFSDDSVNFEDTEMEAKRARMEDIVTGIGTKSPVESAASVTETHAANLAIGFQTKTDIRRPKRKQYIPKQHEVQSSFAHLDVNSLDHMQDIRIESKNLTLEKGDLKEELRQMQEQFAAFREKYENFIGECRQPEFTESIDQQDDFAQRRRHTTGGNNKANDTIGEMNNMRSLPVFGQQKLKKAETKSQTSPLYGDTPSEVEHLAIMLKAEIASSLGNIVDEIVRNFIEKHKIQLNICQPNDPPSPSAVDSKREILSKEVADKIAVKNEENMSDRNRMQRILHQSLMQQQSIFLPHPVRPSVTSGSILTDFKNFNGLDRFVTSAASINRSKMEDDKFRASFLDHPSHFNHKATYDVPRAHLSLFPSALHRAPPPPPPHHSFYQHPQQMPSIHVAAAAAAAAVAAGSFGKEPEQTEALPLVVNTPTKKKKVPTATLR